MTVARRTLLALALSAAALSTPLVHAQDKKELTIGATYNRRASAGWFNGTARAAQNLYDPVDIAPVSPTLTQTGFPSEVNDRGLYVFDRMSVGEQWQLLAGLRKTVYRSEASNPSFSLRPCASPRPTNSCASAPSL